MCRDARNVMADRHAVVSKRFDSAARTLERIGFSCRRRPITGHFYLEFTDEEVISREALVEQLSLSFMLDMIDSTKIDTECSLVCEGK